MKTLLYIIPVILITTLSVPAADPIPAETKLSGEQAAAGTLAIATVVIDGLGQSINALTEKKRSVSALIRNRTEHQLHGGEYFTSRGELKGLPLTIDAKKAGRFEANKSAGLRGTGGVMKYKIGQTGKALVVMWSIPLGYSSQHNWFKYAVISADQWNGSKVFDDMYENKGRLTLGRKAKASSGFTQWTQGAWRTSGTMGNAGNAVLVCDLEFVGGDVADKAQPSQPVTRYSLKVNKVECIEASERRGDDLYLSFDDGTVLPDKTFKTFYDLDDGESWSPGVKRSFANKDSIIQFALYDADNVRRNDDKLGEWRVSASVGSGEKVLKGDGDGSSYKVYYEVVTEVVTTHRPTTSGDARRQY